MLKTLAKIYRQLPVIRELREIRDSQLRSEALLAAAQVVRLLDFELRDHPRYGDPQRLLCYHTQVCSQNSEDGIIHEIFRRIGTTTRDFVEVGVGTGSENNTAFLLSQGWTGFWIDGCSDYLQALKGRPDLGDGCLRHRTAHVTAENVASLFEQLGVPPEFDLLSLDIDQNTHRVWQALTDFRPRVAVIEYNAAIPPDVEWEALYDPQRAWDGSQNYGASLKALERIGRGLGYSLVGCDITGVNAFFVRKELTAGQFAEPFTAENHYEPVRYAMIHRRGHRAAILDRQAPG